MTDYKQFNVRFPVRGLAADPLPQEVNPGNKKPGTGEWHVHDEMHVLDRRIWKYYGWEPWNPNACPTIVLDDVLPPVFPFIAYYGKVTASGGLEPYTYEIVDGALPPGLSLNPNTGEITGIPQFYYCPTSDGIGGSLL